MRSPFLRLALTYILCVTLLLIIGMKLAISKPEEADADAASAAKTEMLSYTNITKTSIPIHKPQPLTAPAIGTAPKKAASTEAAKVKTASPPSVTPYETTAYYLNVRANPYVGSKILDTVPKGTRLEVLDITGKGWLRLKGGGYVHGDYAKKVAAAPQSEPAPQFQPQAAPRPQFTSQPAPRPKTDVPEKSGQPVRPTSLVKSKSGLTEDQIAAFFEGTALSGHGLEKAVLETEKEYGVNAYFTIAVMKLESGNGKSRLAKKKNNLFGLNAIDGDEYDKALNFKTKGDSVRKFAQLIAKNYVGKGYTTVEKVARKYCPANSKWSGYVKNIMKRDFKKL